MAAAAAALGYMAAAAIRNDNMSNTCSLCNSTYVWPADLKRHLKNQPRSTKVYSRTEKDHL
jgi:hypothetical protein